MLPSRLRLPAVALSLAFAGLAACKNPGDDVDPKVRADGHYLAGSAAYLKGDFAEAHKQYAEVRSLNPADPRLSAAEGEVYLAEGNVAEATKLFEAAAQADPKRSTNWSRLGYLYSLKGPEERPKAVEALGKALSLNPRDFNAHESMADLHLKEGRLDEAVKSLLAASEAAPDTSKAELVLKAVGELVKQGRGSDALPVLEAAAKKGVRGPEVLSELGDRLVEAARLPEAIAVYTEAAKASPRDPTLWELVGELELKLDKPAEAEAAFRESLKVKDRGVVHAGLARLCQKKKNDACVQKELDLALKQASGEELRELTDIADLLVSVGRKEEALRLLVTVSEEPDQKANAELQLKTARLAKDLKRAAELEAACARALSGGVGVKCP